MQEQALIKTEGLLFTLKEITYSPVAPRLKEPFTVKGKIELFGISFLPPVWVIATATYPEAWWEEITPIIGAPQVREKSMAVGGDFEVTFSQGFEREGEFHLAVRLYAGPTWPIDKVTLPPFPPVATEETTFIVAGEVPPEERVGFRNFKIVSYSKNGGPAVSPPDVLELELGDRCRVNIAFEHKGDVVTKELYSAIGNVGIWGFDEIVAGKKRISVAASADWQEFADSVDIAITSAISPGVYDLYAKIDGITPEVISPTYEDVISIVGVPTKPEFRNLEIIGYDASLLIGDTCHVSVRFDYQGPATSKRLYSAIGNAGVWGFDEIITGSKSISVPETLFWKAYEATVDIRITTAISPGVYDLYAKIDTVISPFYENVISIEEKVAPPPVPEAEFVNVDIIGYDARVKVGDTCHVKVRFGYRGPATSGRLYASIGNAGIWGFDEILYGSKYISIPETLSWEAYEDSVDIRITTAISPGVYDLYAKIDTVISPFVENVITIEEEVAPPPAPPAEYTLTTTVSPRGTGSVTGEGTYRAETYATCYATPAEGYEFDHWGGDATGTSRSVRVYMDRNKNVVAYFKKRVEVGYTLTTRVTPMAAGWVVKEPDKDRYSYGETVKLTARTAPGYRFAYWDCDGEWMGTTNPINFMVLADHTITAHFGEI